MNSCLRHCITTFPHKKVFSMERITSISNHIKPKKLKILIANRGECATRITRSLRDFPQQLMQNYAEIFDSNGHIPEIECIGIKVGPDDAHCGQMDSTYGVSSYLSMDDICKVAVDHHVDAVHPGWGFLSESWQFVEMVQHMGVHFIGPSSQVIQILGDKSKAKELAKLCGIPVIPDAVGLDNLHHLLQKSGAIIVKPVSGGGGIGMKIIRSVDKLPSIYKQCQAEALAAFGSADLYAEVLVEKAWHVEVQILSKDGRAISLGSRDCSLQRRRQKVVEFAPSRISPPMLARLENDAKKMAAKSKYTGLGTWEFLVCDADYYFLEVNPRLQVEHTVTEHLIGMDLIHLQLLVTLFNLVPARSPRLTGHAIEARVCMERWIKGKPGMTLPTNSTLLNWQLPTSNGLYAVRVDTAAFPGYTPIIDYDSLLAKVIVHLPKGSFNNAVTVLASKLREFKIEGLETNLPSLIRLLETPRVLGSDFDTNFVEDNWDVYSFDQPIQTASMTSRDSIAVFSPMAATVLHVPTLGQAVQTGETLVILSAMKMQHLITSPRSGIVKQVHISTHQTVADGQVLVVIDQTDKQDEITETKTIVDLDKPRADLTRVQERWKRLQDAHRPVAVARQHAKGMALLLDKFWKCWSMLIRSLNLVRLPLLLNPHDVAMRIWWRIVPTMVLSLDWRESILLLDW
jgi:acetyl/propionyl-CoA carboxylase alpha subunit